MPVPRVREERSGRTTMSWLRSYCQPGGGGRLALLLVAVVTLCCWAAQEASALAIKQDSSETAQSALRASDSQEESKSALSSSAFARSSSADSRRPIWALAHMVNSIKELDYRLARGANAVEVDVTFGRDGDPLYTYHGPPCDCWRHCYQQEDLRDYLDYVRQIAVEEPGESSAHAIGRNLSLLFMDLKLDSLDQRAKARAGSELAKVVLEHLFIESIGNSSSTGAGGAPTMRLILSVNHVQDAELLHNFIHQLELTNSSHLLMDRIGFDVGMNDDLQLIEGMWRRHFGPSHALHLWQGDGYTNCLSPFYNLERLSRALGKRDEPAGFPAKVYHWTIDLHERMRESLRMGVDAVMTNHPERLLSVLQEPEMAHNFRLATRLDDPFTKLTRDSLARSNGETARYERSAGGSSGGLIANLLDVFSSWLSYVREIPIFSLPATLVTSRGVAAKQTRPNQQVPARASDAHKQQHLTPVNLASQSPEYSIDARATSQLQAKPQQEDAHEEAKNSTSYELEGAQQVAQNETVFEPKWYTALASNALVNMMKIMLPS